MTKNQKELKDYSAQVSKEANNQTELTKNSAQRIKQSNNSQKTAQGTNVAKNQKNPPENGH